MNTVSQGGGQLEVGLQTAKTASIKGWEPNERNEFGSLSFSYTVNGTFVNEVISIPDETPGDDTYLQRKLDAYSRNISRHLFQVGVTAEEFNNFVKENWINGIPTDKVGDPESLAESLTELIPSFEAEGQLLVHLGSNNKHYAYSSGVGVFRTYKEETFEELIKLGNEALVKGSDLPSHISRWGQSYICPFFTNAVEISKIEAAIVDYREPEEEPENKEWTVIQETDGQATIFYYTDRFNWNPRVEEVSADFSEPDPVDDEPSDEEMEEVFGI